MLLYLTVHSVSSALFYIQYLPVIGRIILQWILKNWEETGGMDSRSSGEVIVDYFCGHSNVPSSSIKTDNFFNNSSKKVLEHYTTNIHVFATATRKTLQKWMILDMRTDY